MSRLRPLLLAALLVAGCASNPTPHPSAEDVYGPTADTAGPGDAGGGGVADPARAVCEDLGGAFRDDGLCDLDLETAFDGEVPGVPAGGADGARADVVGATVAGEPGAYTFSVTVRSDDTGCDGYADWWEVLALSGELRYRRVLDHSHVDEQPFTRSGGPVPVQAGDLLIVRAHRHPEGYVGHALVGSVAGGFAPVEPAEGLAQALADDEPQPPPCAY